MPKSPHRSHAVNLLPDPLHQRDSERFADQNKHEPDCMCVQCVRDGKLAQKPLPISFVNWRDRIFPRLLEGIRYTHTTETARLDKRLAALEQKLDELRTKLALRGGI